MCAAARCGAEPVLCPVIEFGDPPELEPLRAAVERVGQYQWLLFTSQNGVQRFFVELHRQGGDTRRLGGVRVGAIGQKTASALERHSVRADLVAREFVGEAFARDLVLAERREPGRVLLSRARVARDVVPELLRQAGFEVDVVAAYETRAVGEAGRAAIAELFRDDGLDAVLFTSSSTVENACAALGPRARELLARVTVASIGPVTTATAERLGVRVDVTAAVYTVDGVLDALGEHFAARAPLASR